MGDSQKRWNPPMDIRLASAAASTIFIHPIGTIKVRMQMGVSFLQSRGFGNLYKGYSAGLLRKLSYATFLSYSSSSFSAVSSTGNARKNDIISLTAAFSPSTVAALVLNPLDVAATRMQGDAALHPDLCRNYKNVLHAVYRTAADEGFSALWRGSCPHVLAMLANIFGFITVGVCYKRIFHSNASYNRETRILGACFIGIFVPPIISQPFDYVKTQMQMMQADSRGRYPYTSSLDCAVKTMKLGGLLKFYKGFGAYSLTTSPQLLLILWLQSRAQGMQIDIIS